MIIITIPKDNIYREFIYDSLEKWLHRGYDYLPILFLYNTNYKLKGEIIRLPRVITDRDFNNMSPRCRKFMRQVEN
jgi:hypothetical protein